MVFDFAAMPPEVTSTLVYTGPGAAPLMAAAASYANLAAEVSSTATQWESIISLLTTESWTGGGSAAAAAAAQPIITYLTETAATLEQASAQATASAAAFEGAYMGVVNPALVYANRAAFYAALAGLPFTLPQVAALEAEYEAMWIQDATAMAAYQAASAAAGVLPPVTPLTSTTNPAAASTADSTALATNSTVGTAQALASPLADASSIPSFPGYTTPDVPATGLNLIKSLDGFLGTPSVFNAINGAVNTGAWFTMTAIPTAVSFGHTVGSVPSIPYVADSVTPLPGGMVPGTMVGSVTGAGASAAVGEAGAVGGLSVPASWSAAAPAASAASSTAPLAGSGWTAAAEAEPVSAMPGMPGVAGAAKGAGAYGTGPRYGFKPIVMPKQVVV